jgi:hypothetical protein
MTATITSLLSVQYEDIQVGRPHNLSIICTYFRRTSTITSLLYVCTVEAQPVEPSYFIYSRRAGKLISLFEKGILHNFLIDMLQTSF